MLKNWGFLTIFHLAGQEFSTMIYLVERAFLRPWYIVGSTHVFLPTHIGSFCDSATVFQKGFMVL